MAEPISFRVVCGRAWHDTTHVFDVDQRPKLVVRLVMVVAGLGISFGLFGKAHVIADLGQVGIAVAAFCAVFVLWFLFNLWWAPVRLANDALKRVAERERFVAAAKRDLDRRTEASRPDVTVTPDGYGLRVTNDGGTADFEAKLVVLDGEAWGLPTGTPFYGLWESNRDPRAQIFTHGRDRIVLGRLLANPDQPGTGSLGFSFFNASLQSERERFATITLETRPQLRLEVTILCNPALETPIVREVGMGFDGITLDPE